jgi:hypothetical protein
VGLEFDDLSKKNAPEMQRILGGLRIPTSFRERLDHVDRINASVQTQSSERSKPYCITEEALTSVSIHLQNSAAFVRRTYHLLTLRKINEPAFKTSIAV